MSVEPTELPADVVLQRTTAELDAASIPAGLLRAHRVAAQVWGVLRVREGSLRLVWEGEEGPDAVVDLGPGGSIVLPPEVPHRVELGEGARFVVEFHR